MKKIKNFKAFSLAEALVTLLIVCLITIASIPIITKKKRTANTGANGFYVCTINSSGEYVEFNSTSPEGDRNKPDTWRKVSSSKDAEGNEIAASHCTFMPPLNAKNFGVTLIGGGGAGAKGNSYYERVLGDDGSSPKTGPYTVQNSDDWYQLTMVGGGGGGGYGYEGKRHRTAAGGGAGAYITGKVRFKEGLTLRAVYSTDGGKESNPVSWSSGGKADVNGGSSTIYRITGSSETPLFNVAGGDSIHGATCRSGTFGSKCYGGGTDYVAAATINDSSILKAGKLFSGNGEISDYAVIDRFTTWINKSALHNWAWIRPGNGTPVVQEPTGRVNYDGTLEYQIFGGGGAGTYNCSGGTPEKCVANPGNPGYFGLDKIITNHGSGGKAAVPNTVAVPKIKGYLKISVGKGGLSDDDANTSANGEITKVEVYNTSGKYIRQYIANGGESGTNSENLNEPQIGQNSLWDNKGGGAVGSCTDTDSTQESARTYTVLQETGKCLAVLGVGEPRSTSPNAHAQEEYGKDLYSKSWQKISAISGYDTEPTSWCQRSPEQCRLKATDIYNNDYLGFNDSQVTYLRNGQRSAFSYGNYCVNSVCNKTFYGHMWYCSPTKALETIQEDYPETKLEDLDANSNFMCMFPSTIPAPIEGSNEPDERDEVYKLVDKIQENPLMTATDKSSLNSDVSRLFSILNTDKSGTSNTWKYRTYWSDYNALGTHAFEYTCIKPELKEVVVTAKNFVPAKPPTCTDSSAGNSYGAGGGGGFASDFVGAFGYGGAGAPGAVIIEW